MADVPPDVTSLLDSGDATFPIKVQLDRVIEFGSALYYVFILLQEEQGLGEPLLVKRPINGEAIIIDDFEGLPQIPVPASFDDAQSVDLSLFALSSEEALATRPPGPVMADASERQDRKLRDAAATAIVAGSELISKQARGTNGGRLACAWAVNRVVERALGRPILAGPSGLATANLVKVLRAKHVKVREPVPGCIVISPTQYHPRANIGHVGVVGANNDIFSNSSRQAKWVRNFTVDSWNRYYGDRKKLPVEYFRLDEVYFP
ncbi:hypothetical protein [Mesorhizobium sp. M0522]|uniref:hypothetical protein n=1 Tax=Mesorhizobium sp. M0522 TaxID=2956958 RepID=UPI00333C1C35